MGGINPWPIFFSLYFYYYLNRQVLFCDIHDSHFDDRSLKILQSCHTQSFILKSGDSVHDHTNNNFANLNLNSLYFNTIMNRMRNHVTLKFMPSNINSVLVKTWESFKLSFAKITQEDFNNIHIWPLFSTHKGVNHQACLAATQMYNDQKLNDIKSILNSSVART